MRNVDVVIVGASRAALMGLRWRERRLVVRDIWRFIVLYKEFKWGRQIVQSALDRLSNGSYTQQRWI